MSVHDYNATNYQFYGLRYIETPEHENSNGTTLNCVKNQMELLGNVQKPIIEGNRIIDMTNLLPFIPENMYKYLNTEEKVQAFFDIIISVSAYTFNCNNAESVYQDVLVAMNSNPLFSTLTTIVNVDLLGETEEFGKFVLLVKMRVELDWNEVLAGWKPGSLGLVIVEVFVNEH